MPRLRRLNRLCSSTVADTANRLLMRTDTEGSPSVAEEKSSAVPHFRSGRRSPIFAGLTNKGKVGVQRGRETAGVPSFLPPRRAPRRSRRPQTANPLAEVQQKNCRPLGANTLTQFEYPAQPVLKKLPPVRGEPPAQFACPGQPVQKRSRPSGANTLMQFECPGQPVLKNCRPLGANRLRSSRAPVNRCRITGEICDTTLFYYKMHPLLRQAQPPGEA